MSDFATSGTVAYQASLSIEFSGNNTGVGWHVLLQGIFLTQGLNLGLLYCRQFPYQLNYQRHNSVKMNKHRWIHLSKEGQKLTENYRALLKERKDLNSSLTDWNHNHRKLANLITQTTALSNSMKLSHAM